MKKFTRIKLSSTLALLLAAQVSADTIATQSGSLRSNGLLVNSGIGGPDFSNLIKKCKIGVGERMGDQIVVPGDRKGVKGFYVIGEKMAEFYPLDKPVKQSKDQRLFHFKLKVAGKPDRYFAYSERLGAETRPGGFFGEGLKPEEDAETYQTLEKGEVLDNTTRSFVSQALQARVEKVTSRFAEMMKFMAKSNEREIRVAGRNAHPQPLPEKDEWDRALISCYSSDDEKLNAVIDTERKKLKALSVDAIIEVRRETPAQASAADGDDGKEQ